MTKKVTEKSELMMHMIIRLENGEIAENTRRVARPTKVIMGNGSLSENFERALVGLTEGERKSFSLPAKDAFGEPLSENLMVFPRTQFAENVEVEEGMMIEFENMQGGQMIGIVRSIQDDQVTVDFNHPLAGHHLEFDIEILEIH